MMATKITLDLDDPDQTIELLKKAARFAMSDGWDGDSSQHARWVADQIKAQLPEPEPEPEPSEPKGDVVVMDAWAHAWLRDDDSGLWHNDVYPASPLSWESLCEQYEDPHTVYRPEPSPERIEELVQKHARPFANMIALRAFAAALLGGEG